MKLDLIMLLSNDIEDLNVIKKIIKKFNLIESLGKVSLKKLLDKLKECGYNHKALDLAFDPYVLRKRTIKEQLKLMDKLKEYEYNAKALDIALGKYIFGRTLEAQLKLMYNEFEKTKTSNKTFNAFIDSLTTKDELNFFLNNVKSQQGNIDIKLTDKVANDCDSKGPKILK